MKTIIDRNTGKELYAANTKIQLAENEIAIDELRTEVMENPYFNFETRTFYDNPTV